MAYENEPFIEDGEEPRPAAEPTPEPETPEQEEPARDAFAPLTTPTYALAIDPSVPASELPGDYADQVEGFAGVAAKSGLLAGVAQRLLDTFVNASFDHAYDKSLTDIGAMEDALTHLRAAWGSSFDENLAHVRAAVKRLGPAFSAYLDETGLGNHPGALEALAAYGRGDLTLTKADARAKLDALMKSSRFTAPKSTTEARKQAAVVRNLHKIANSVDDVAPARDPFAAMKARHSAAPAAASAATPPDTRESIRRELHTMMADRRGALMTASHPDHKAAVQRMHTLLAKLN